MIKRSTIRHSSGWNIHANLWNSSFWCGRADVNVYGFVARHPFTRSFPSNTLCSSSPLPVKECVYFKSSKSFYYFCLPTVIKFLKNDTKQERTEKSQKTDGKMNFSKNGRKNPKKRTEMSWDPLGI